MKKCETQNLLKYFLKTYLNIFSSLTSDQNIIPVLKWKSTAHDDLKKTKLEINCM